VTWVQRRRVGTHNPELAIEASSPVAALEPYLGQARTARPGPAGPWATEIRRRR
jgi:hypothetical protein